MVIDPDAEIKRQMALRGAAANLAANIAGALASNPEAIKVFETGVALAEYALAVGEAIQQYIIKPIEAQGRRIV